MTAGDFSTRRDAASPDSDASSSDSGRSSSDSDRSSSDSDRSDDSVERRGDVDGGKRDSGGPQTGPEKRRYVIRPGRSPLSRRPENEVLSETPPVKSRPERKRLGKIVRYLEDKNFGFIEAEDFRDDVYFHLDVFEPVDMKMTYDDGTKVGMHPTEMLWVEFELDSETISKDDKLRAKAVRPSRRPEGRRMTGRDATFNVYTRHPKSLRKKPSWRK